MIEVWVSQQQLLDMLDTYEGNKLYPRIQEGDEIVNIKIFGAYQVCFEIGKPTKRI